MKKKLLAVAMCAVAVVSLAGCSGKISNEYITINQYKGLEVAKVEETEITDDDVESQVQSNLEATAITEDVTDRASEDGDTVNISATTDFENGNLDNTDIEIGSGSLIGANGDYKSFEDQLIGHNVGDTFDVTAQFPDDYEQSAELAGQAKTWSVTINSISKSTTPELTDEWVEANSEESKTVDEYKEEVKKTLEENNTSSTNSTLQSEVLAALLEQVEVKKYPDGDVEDQVSEMTEYYQSYAEQYGMEFADFLEQQLGMTEDEFTTQLQSAAEDTVKQTLAVELLADKKNLEPSDKQYQEEYEKLASDYGYEDVDSLIEAAGEDTLKRMILQEKVADYLIESCVQVEEDDATDSSTSTSTEDTAE